MNKLLRHSLNLVLLATLFVVLIQGCTKDSSNTDTELPTLSVGIQVSPAMALVMVAEDAGLFDSAGVDVEIREFTAGKFALQAFLGGSLDIAVSGEVPVTLSTLQGNSFRTISQVVERTINECRIIARKDGELDTPEAFFSAKRRKLATSFGGGPEFFTHEFFKHYGIDLSQVELISQRPEDMPGALISGSVDAVSIFDPFARISELQLGDDGITFSNAEVYSELYVANVMEQTLEDKKAALLAFLKGLDWAHHYINDNPTASKEIVADYTKLDIEIIDDIWENFVFKPAINHLFVDYTTAQAKWMIEKGTFPEDTPVPNFREVLHTDLLAEINPEAVTVE